MEDLYMREKWKSSFGFVMASAGAAIGLGNLWRFPYLVGNDGGGAFLILYLIFIVLIGFSVTIAEAGLGRYAASNIVGSFRKIHPGLAFAGGLGILSAYLLFSYYSVIGGWIIKYAVTYLTGRSLENPEAYFADFTSQVFQPIFFQVIFILLTGFIVYKGIAKGIEKYSKILLPVLFVLLIVTAVRGITLPNAMEGIRFFLEPDFSKLTAKTFVDAMGQVFFSLSLGLGAVITYGSYLDKKENIIKASVLVPTIDTIMAVICGFAILPPLFSFGLGASQGPSLMFVSLPLVFSKMFMGNLFGMIFFLLVFFAAVTSSISMLEIITAYFTETFHVGRKKATLILCTGVILLGIPCSLSFGVLSDFHLFGLTVFDLFDKLISNILLPVGAILLCIAVGHIWGVKNAVREVTNQGTLSFRLWRIWGFLIRYIVPAVIFVVFLAGMGILRV